MWIISKARLREFWERHADAKAPLEFWHKATERARWTNVEDVRRVFGRAEGVKVASGRTMTVFNIAGNKYRLVAGIRYEKGKVYVRRIMTHAEYSRGRWRDEL